MGVRECELFGKRYMWVTVMGRLELRPAIDWTAKAELGPPRFSDVVDALLEFEMSGSAEAIGGFIRDRAVRERLNQIGEN
jgi:hypothetical protein